MTPYQKVRQLMGSLLFNAVAWISVAIYGPLMLLTFPLPFPQRFYLISRWSVFQLWMLRVLCGVRYEVRGREHVPAGPAIIMCKHQSAWETLSLQSIIPPQTWVLKRELMWIPVFGWALALLKPIAIDRRSPRAAIQQVIAQGRERLDAGICVIIFPEGTRLAPGERRRWAQSGAVLAAQSGYPIIPVAHNAGLFWPRRSILKRPGTIQLVIGPAIVPQDRDHQEILQRAEDWVTRTMEEIEGVKSEKLNGKS